VAEEHGLGFGLVVVFPVVEVDVASYAGNFAALHDASGKAESSLTETWHTPAILTPLYEEPRFVFWFGISDCGLSLFSTIKPLTLVSFANLTPPFPQALVFSI
jgi:hypothetical protein